MSVLIKDMDMPKTCGDCPFHIYHSHHEYVCVATLMFYPMNLANSKGIRKDWCPLSEAPEPCEDAVSRKKMFETIIEYRNQLCEIFGDESALVNTVDIVKHRLIALPPVQPELIEKAAYSRGFEQGRTQGMIDSKGGKK